MKLWLLIIVFLAILFGLAAVLKHQNERLWWVPIYTMTPNQRTTTLENIAQMWWQPVAYIQNAPPRVFINSLEKNPFE